MTHLLDVLDEENAHWKNCLQINQMVFQICEKQFELTVIGFEGRVH